MFHHRVRMTRSAIGCVATGVLIAAVGMAWAASQGVVFRDKDDNMSLSGLGSWATTRVDEDTLSFRGSGNPFRGRWRDQGLVVTAQRIEGTAKKGPKGAFSLASATISGGVRAELAQFGPGGASRNSVLNCSATTFSDRAEGPRLVATGSVVLTDFVQPDAQTVRLEGPSATIDLYPFQGRRDWPIRAATIPGPVQAVLTRVFKDSGGGARTAKVVATGNRLSYDDASRTLTLAGNVRVEGDDAAMSGIATAARARIILDERRYLKEVQLEGDPGTSTLTEKKRP